MRFPDTCPVEVLKGEYMLSKGGILKALAVRAAWLAKKVSLKEQMRESTFLKTELKATLQAAMFVEKFMREIKDCL